MCASPNGFKMSVGTLFLMYAATGSRMSASPLPEYPPVQIDIAGGCNGTESDCISLPTCEWLAHVSDFANATDIETARRLVTDAIESVNQSSWDSLQLPQSVMGQILAHVSNRSCSLEKERTQWREFPYHPWEFQCMDGPIAAPLNHKVLIENDKVRIVNVYGIPYERENFHVHKRMSMFIQWGVGPMPITQYDENNHVVHDQPSESISSDMELSVMWWPPQWLHSNYYKKGSESPKAANCPLHLAPYECTGYFYRVEFKLPGWA